MKIFELSKTFPKEEMYALTDQMRRSSRAVCANLAEAHRKRQYPKHFVSKISDSDSENAETQTWLEYSVACGYASREQISPIWKSTEEVGRLLGDMMRNPSRDK